MHKEVHDSLGRIWTLIRSKRAALTADDVRKIVTIIDQRFKPWYNTVYNPASASQLAAAEASTKAEIMLLLAHIRTP